MLRQFDEDTIAAIATPPGEGGIGIVRLSGPEAIGVADKIFRSKSGRSVREQRSFTVQVGWIVSNGVVDEALMMVMRGPKSYTREDMVEISAHGGTAVLQAILELALKAGARLALPGEFTKRAFLGGRVDLVQAEAVLDLIKAKTELASRWAAAQLEGALSRKIQAMKEELLHVLSHLEASIDFPDDFLEPDGLSRIEERLKKLEEGIGFLLDGSRLGILAKQGFKAAILGRPNVGKSSLMNKLAGSNRVIVTPYPGTTRDVVEEEVRLRGFPMRIWDTAGLRETTDPIEKEGIRRSQRAMREADILLYVVDGSQEWTREDTEWFGRLNGAVKLVVVNKADLPQKIDGEELEQKLQGDSFVRTSCVREDGTRMLEDEIFRLVTKGAMQVSDEVVVSSVRQKDLLEKALRHLKGAVQACREGFLPELVAVDIREALYDLGVLVGEVYTDDLLEVLFNQFCIGK
ncbi:MAG: tRNA uridine-5-carboxymethylaminomethyl(34) synthesis GTPase MnmE [Candidatus Omnitrophica bacterium]|nr:tRNA uridine-5-carboxymethylaminomethyl(34) synthesis GTPase MnmE [Candidatus Omnitrophota bacterium]